jgi:hypothetical protein
VDFREIEALIAANPRAEVALCSYNWPALAQWQNVWLPVEKYHPGLIRCAEDFLRSIGHRPDLARSIGDFRNSVYSNYVIARPRFWRAWAALARSYHDYVDHAPEPRADDGPASYGGPVECRMKTFVQERLACWILQSESFETVHLDYPNGVPIGNGVTRETPELDRARRLLSHADRWKRIAQLPGLRSALLLHRRAAKAGIRIVRRHRAGPLASD